MEIAQISPLASSENEDDLNELQIEDLDLALDVTAEFTEKKGSECQVQQAAEILPVVEYGIDRPDITQLKDEKPVQRTKTVPSSVLGKISILSKAVDRRQQSYLKLQQVQQAAEILPVESGIDRPDMTQRKDAKPVRRTKTAPSSVPAKVNRLPKAIGKRQQRDRAVRRTSRVSNAPVLYVARSSNDPKTDKPRAVTPKPPGVKLLGRSVEKHFEGHGQFLGFVQGYSESTGFRVCYSDGDEEDMAVDSLLKILVKPGVTLRSPKRQKLAPIAFSTTRVCSVSVM